ncbi:4F2 cell-surface antigen heavy chain-like, partial [Plectropomus leopardus]|uniref:4F2 cell-surface antigen heavy chain-like n=1 Tax=Plectropomus leopardus TaxID=160734 RepID=UPI001C4AC349
PPAPAPPLSPPAPPLSSCSSSLSSCSCSGVEERLSGLSDLKVGGVVVGPIHVAPGDDVLSLRFEEVSSEAGSLQQFKDFVAAAHKKGISVVLDLTPNYQGSFGPWFSNTSVTNVAERLKSALVFWMNEDVDGVQLAGVERVSTVVPSLWTDIRAIVQNGTKKDSKNKRVLIGLTERSSAEDVSALLSSTGVDLLISRVLRPGGADAMEHAQSVQLLYSNHSQLKLAWSLGGPAEGHLASLVGPALVRLHQLLLLTLPGTPVINYGDEIGLMDKGTKFPRMLWDSDEQLNGTLQVNKHQRHGDKTLDLHSEYHENWEESVQELQVKVLSAVKFKLVRQSW